MNMNNQELSDHARALARLHSYNSTELEGKAKHVLFEIASRLEHTTQLYKSTLDKLLALKKDCTCIIE
jgi:nitrate reductase assembly molybdenum cofactor insertion protein NarJ